MNTKGFTLVELLAVIVILSLLALLTTTAITKLVSDAKSDLSDTQIQLIKSAAQVWGADNLMKLPKVGECSYITLANLKEYGLIDSNVIDAETDKPISNDLKIKITTTLSAYGNSVTNYEVNPDNVNGCLAIYSSSCYAITGSGKNVGDKIACNLGETIDNFYVISNNGTRIQMLTEKNINTTTYRQSDNAGTVAFSTTNYWSSETTYPVDVYDKGDNNPKPIVNEYVSYLNTKLTNATGSLLTYSQAENLGCSGSGYSCSSAPSWVYSTNYWLGSAKDTTYVRPVDSLGNFGYASYDYDGDFGVRPVITIPVSELQ